MRLDLSKKAHFMFGRPVVTTKLLTPTKSQINAKHELEVLLNKLSSYCPTSRSTKIAAYSSLTLTCATFLIGLKAIAANDLTRASLQVPLATFEEQWTNTYGLKHDYNHDNRLVNGTCQQLINPTINSLGCVKHQFDPDKRGVDDWHKGLTACYRLIYKFCTLSNQAEQQVFNRNFFFAAAILVTAFAIGLTVWAASWQITNTNKIKQKTVNELLSAEDKQFFKKTLATANIITIDYDSKLHEAILTLKNIIDAINCHQVPDINYKV